MESYGFEQRHLYSFVLSHLQEDCLEPEPSQIDVNQPRGAATLRTQLPWLAHTLISSGEAPEEEASVEILRVEGQDGWQNQKVAGTSGK